MRTVEEATTRMEAIAAVLPVTDGVACFNRMYLTVTREVGARIGVGFFADPDFMTHLDVSFANLFFAAYDRWTAKSGSVPRAWAVLFSRRAAPGVAPMQFALAGLNAHINRDLALAVVATCGALATAPDERSHEADYHKVNAVLGELDQSIRQSFETGVILDLDRRFAHLEDLVGNFSITAAREVAWAKAEVLWHIRHQRPLTDAFVDSLDRTVAFAGRALLTPLARADG